MKMCQSCGEESPDRFRVCPICATPLDEAAAPRREERKVVTVLFCDLVGFTARSESMDVEDVRGTLQPYHHLLRGELEGHGGTVEKFIGDAVMAVFGAPTSHEDDAERAVRAALSILEAIAELRERDGPDLHVRIGVNTGEALVALDADPGRGEGMASGDVVNTAARLESAAPVDGVLVGESTYRATVRAIVYEAAAAIAAKGKSDPVPAWRAIEARSRFGTDVVQDSGVAMVGRDAELAALRGALDRAFAAREAQLVTLVGVPGIGKSRLVWELGQWVDARKELITWRQGRCLPYGDGVTYWALGEILKAEAGVLESDSAAVAAEKVEAMVTGAMADAGQAEWVGRHVRSLVGIDRGESGGSGDRAESFSAWRRLLEALAGRRSMVAVFEDLHWADEAMLDFLDHLAEWATDVPLMIVCTARPELLERRPSWGGGKANTSTIALRPLSDADTSELLSALIAGTALDTAVRAALLERAEGNPLYAEEYVRMLADRGSASTAADGPLPESVQGIIAARLDMLSPEEKGLLQDASVLGKVVWLGALVQLGGADGWALEDRLHRLTRKEFLRRAQQSSVEDETEYVFRHALVRDVAYQQIPRGDRAEKHRRAAEWIDGLSEDRDDAIEMRAHHLGLALDYARAAGRPTDGLVERARAASRAAGDRAAGLEAFAAAAIHYRAALELCPEDLPERAHLLLGLGRARINHGERGDAELDEAIRLFTGVGDRASAAVAHCLLARSYMHQGDGELRTENVLRALELIADAPASDDRARALLMLAGMVLVESRYQSVVDLLDQYLDIADAVGMPPDWTLGAHAFRGLARMALGDPSGLDEEERAVAELRRREVWDVGTHVHNLAADHLLLGNVGRYDELLREASMWVARQMPWRQGFVDSELACAGYLVGRWDDELARIASLEQASQGGELTESRHEPVLLGLRALILDARGDHPAAARLHDSALAAARRTGEAQVYAPELATAARLALIGGDRAAAAVHLDELLGMWVEPLLPNDALPYWRAELAETAELLGRGAALATMLGAIRLNTPWKDALLASLAGDHARAAAVYEGMGSAVDAAFAHLRAAEAGASGHLEPAVAFYRAVAATAYLDRAARAGTPV